MDDLLMNENGIQDVFASARGGRRMDPRTWKRHIRPLLPPPAFTGKTRLWRRSDIIKWLGGAEKAA